VTAEGSRRYPARPGVGVGAIVVDAEGRVVLVKRTNPPLAGRWSLPGGLVELGETIQAAVTREVREETGLDVDVGPLVEVLERIHHDADERVEYHFVLLDYLCRPTGGTLAAASDAADVVVATLQQLDGYGIAAATRAVIDRALRLHAMAGGPSPI
jgi:mutator protein MutT